LRRAIGEMPLGGTKNPYCSGPAQLDGGSLEGKDSSSSSSRSASVSASSSLWSIGPVGPPWGSGGGAEGDELGSSDVVTGR
jgi:hypothetical protein